MKKRKMEEQEHELEDFIPPEMVKFCNLAKKLGYIEEGITQTNPNSQYIVTKGRLHFI